MYPTTGTGTWDASHRFGTYRLTDFESICVTGAQFPFARFCLRMGMSFSFLEEADGRFLHPEGLERSVRESDPQMYAEAKALGLFDASQPLIDKIYADVPEDGWQGAPRVVRFDVSEEIAKLPAETLEALRGLFAEGEGARRASPAADHVLLLITQHFANLKMMTMEEQKRLYLNTVDYYLGAEEALFVKPHPDDLMYYEELFPDAVVYPANLLIELLTELKAFQHARILAVNSTAVHAFPEAEILSFSSDYLKTFQDLPMYAAVRAICKAICEQKALPFCSFGADHDIFRNWGMQEKETTKGITFLCKMPDDIHLLENSPVVISPFWNQALQDIRQEQNCRMLVKRVMVSSAQGETLYQKKLFLLLKDDALCEAVASIEKTCELKYSKETFQMENLSEKDIEIAALKGMIESLERRLKVVIKENDELREEIKNVCAIK